MEMDLIWRMFDGLQNKIGTSYNAASSSRSAPPDPQLFRALRMINEHVYEVYKPTGSPAVEIVVFHGLQLESSNFHHIHGNTWISRGEPPELWLNWLGDHVSGARILAVCYDASSKKTHREGITDMYVTCENLIHSLTEGNSSVGQKGCPVVLVGHCLGGLVMKELCLMANKIISLESNERVENFLANVKGLFTYASPHHGSRLVDCNIKSHKGLLFQGLKTLDTDGARQNEDFRKLRKKYEWKAFGVGEAFPVTLVSNPHRMWNEEVQKYKLRKKSKAFGEGSLRFERIVVEEASARHDVDGFHTISADHFNVCRPVSRMCDSFQLLSNFVSEVVEKGITCTRLLDGLKIVGREASIGDVLKKLNSNRRLGLVGMGGIGKTTLAKAVYDELSEKFDYTCFLDEVKLEMKKEEPSNALRAKIKKRLKRKGRDAYVNETFNWNELKGKKVLIILDDAEFRSQVLVMTKEDDFSEESCVIVTSRRVDFLSKEDFEIYKVGKLDLEESKRLFCLHAFGQPGAPPDYEDRVTKFVKKCDGLPLALKVSGSYLFMQKEKPNQAVDEEHDRKDRKALWDEALEKLSSAKSLDGSADHEDQLLSILTVSYGALGDSEREMFLDAATWGHQVKLTKVQKAWGACSWGSPQTGWKTLLDRSLVSEDDNGRISMHELLRDLGRKIAGKSRVWDVEDLRQLNQEEKAKVKVLTVGLLTVDGCLVDIDILFPGLKELQILWLDYVYLHIEDGDPIGKRRPGTSLRFELEEFQALRQLVLKQCSPVNSFFRGVQLRALKYLQIKDSESDKTLPESVGQLTALEHLKLSCWELKTLPTAIGKLDTLHSLEIVDCFCLQKLPESVGQLKALRYLNIHGCHRLETLPKSVGQLTALRHLNITWCDGLKTIPTSVGELRALERLSITSYIPYRSDPLIELPESIGDLHGLRHLDIAHCSFSLSTVSQLSALEDLRISKCGILGDLPERVGQLQAMRHLYLDSNKWSSSALLDTLKLDKLEKLTIIREEVHNFRFGQHSALRYLLISGCSFRTLPRTLLELPALEDLRINCCLKFEELPEDVGQLRALRRLFLSNVPLKTLPASLGALPKLETLKVWDLTSLENFPGFPGQFPALRRLILAGCWSLKASPGILSGPAPPALETLTIRSCRLIEEPPKWVHESPVYIHLVFTSTKISRIIEPLNKLTVLNHHHHSLLESTP